MPTARVPALTGRLLAITRCFFARHSIECYTMQSRDYRVSGLSKSAGAGGGQVLNPNSRSSPDGNHQLSAGMPGFKMTDCLGRLTQWIAALDDRLHLSGFHEAH